MNSLPTISRYSLRLLHSYTSEVLAKSCFGKLKFSSSMRCCRGYKRFASCRRSDECCGWIGRTECMSPKLTPDEWRAIDLAALVHDANVNELSRQYGVSRARMYQLMEGATTDPKGKPRDRKEICLQEERAGAGRMGWPCGPRFAT
jgi:hypothetical protein